MELQIEKQPDAQAGFAVWSQPSLTVFGDAVSLTAAGSKGRCENIFNTTDSSGKCVYLVTPSNNPTQRR